MTCLDCGFAWRSRAMADGLRVIGSCPKCRGRLEFAEAEPPADAPEAPAPEPVRSAAPHLVLGVPRRW